MVKWLATHADDPTWLIVAAVTVLLPGIVIVAAAGVVATHRSRPERAVALAVVGIVGALAAVVWYALLAPWQGMVGWG